MKQLKKVSVSTVFGKVSAEEIAELKASGSEKYVGRFYGLASGSKTGVTQFGIWTALTGSFRAVDAKTGEISTGANLLLPMGLCEQVAETIKAKIDAGEVPQIAIAVDLFIKFRVVGAEEKYEYIARTNEVADQEDPLERLASSLGAMPVSAALGAPVKQEAIENSSTEKPKKK